MARTRHRPSPSRSPCGGGLSPIETWPKVLDCDCVDDTWYFAMEYIEGENLRKMLNAVGAMCWQQVVEIGVQIANGLSAIHAADLIHRDIKPSNIMLAANGVAKITDLGLVKIKGLERRHGPHLRRSDSRHALLHGPRAIRR
ncbi:MAG: protein kinase [Phycisphaerae bacterium]